MDLQRGIIFVGLAIVSYLMILAWNEDYGHLPNDAVNSQTQIKQRTGSNDQFDSLPTKLTNTSKSQTDEFTTPEQANNISFSTTSVKNASTHYIHIKTDVLDIAIDLTGGNVVESLLTKYKLHEKSKQLLPILESSNKRHFIAESGLYGINGFDSSKNGPTPVYNTIKQNYVMSQAENTMNVDLHYKSKNGIDIIKRYSFEKNSYLIKVSYIIKNNSTKPWTANFSAKLKRDESPDPSEQNSMGMHSFLGMALSSKKDPYQKFTFKEMKEKPVSEDIQGGWIAFNQHYFLTAWIPNNHIEHRYQTKFRNGEFLMGFTSPQITVQPGQQKEVGAELYTGPKIISKLEKAAPKLDLTVDFGWLFFIAIPLFKILQFFHELVGNWGISIIMVTISVKALFFKLSEKSYKSMANMRRVGPQLQRLKEQFGDDRQKMSQAMMDLYKKEKINPLGGCLPVLVQMPVFISLYWVLLESVQLRQAPFFLWITDLSVKDPFFILPILMGISMYIQMQLNPTPPDPMQAKIMKIMPVMFTVFFLWFPAGLVLYWLVNNILSISQQWVITKRIEKEGNKS